MTKTGNQPKPSTATVKSFQLFIGSRGHCVTANSHPVITPHYKSKAHGLLKGWYYDLPVLNWLYKYD